jgi:succinoglycan biosynthesis protein ExoA
MLEWPTVSIIIPCYNESTCLNKCLDSIIASDYDFNRAEIIIVDGMSDDGTREIIENYCRRYHFIRLIDNIRRLKPAGSNLGIEASSYEYVLIMDGHTAYPPDYIKKVIRGSAETKSDNYGGIVEVLPQENTMMGRTLAAVNTSPFAVGNAHYRIGSKEVRQVDTVPFGCFKRTLFNRIGMFHPDLPRAEDRDMNARIKASGGTIYLDPSVKCQYFIRSRLLDYLKWIHASGYWVFYANHYTPVRFRSWRNYVPLLFLLYCIVLVAACFLTPPVVVSIISIPLVLYVLLNMFFSCRIAVRTKEPMSAVLALFVFPMTHMAYGRGSLRGILRLIMDATAPDMEITALPDLSRNSDSM